jgi:ankyrin repeat protein
MPTYDREDWFEAERLHRAAQDGNLAELMRLVADGYDVNLFDDLGHTPLHRAAEGGHGQAAAWLLGHGADVNANDEATIGETALALAVQRDDPDIVELLLRQGADPDIQGWMGNTARSRAGERKDAAGLQIQRLIERHAPAR